MLAQRENVQSVQSRNVRSVVIERGRDGPATKAALLQQPAHKASAHVGYAVDLPPRTGQAHARKTDWFEVTANCRANRAGAMLASAECGRK
jgi:hypothetical protein